MRYEKWELAARAPSAEYELIQGDIPLLVAKVLSARGIKTPQGAVRFLEDGPHLMIDPMELQDMDLAVERIRKAVERGEKIAIYGDYDVDGVTATCLLVRCLRNMGADCLFYIPDRVAEGYGLNCEAIAHLSDQGVTLLITVDCGITAVEEVVFAKGLGMDVVITDHHKCKEGLPPAVAVIDPHRTDCTYPFAHLAGVGVAMKLALALAREEDREDVFLDCAPLAAVGTVADVMSLTGENRFMIRTGLRLLAECLREETAPRQETGFKMLMREAGLAKRGVSASGIGYLLAPRLNAAGRMGKASLAAELLLTQDEELAQALSKDLCNLNRERQAIELSIYQQALERIESMPAALRFALVLEDETWHQGVVGIVASRLAERFACPVFMICLDGERGKGSCRSYGGINLFDALSENGDLLEGFGGHALAAGFTLIKENIPGLRQKLNDYVRGKWVDGPPVSVLDVDVLLEHPSVLTTEQVEALSVLEPHGQDNPKPLFSMEGLSVVSLNHVGDGRHLKLRLQKEGQQLDAICFSSTSKDLKVYVGDQVDIVFSPQINEFRGQRTVQLVLSDLRPCQWGEETKRELYHRYKEGRALTGEEARRITPSRAEFAGVWRYLGKQAAYGGVYEGNLSRLSREVSLTCSCVTDMMRTMVCLDVFEERGLIVLRQGEQELHITPKQTEAKVDLEQSPIMIALRKWQRQEKEKQAIH